MGVCACVSQGESSCGNYSVGVRCLPCITQGSDAQIELQLMDESGLAMSSDSFHSITVYLYDSGDQLIGTWADPQVSGTDELIRVEDTTDTVGLLLLKLPKSLTPNILTGNISVEILLEETLTGTTTANKSIVSCFKVGIIHPTKYIRLTEEDYDNVSKNT